MECIINDELDAGNLIIYNRDGGGGGVKTKMKDEVRVFCEKHVKEWRINANVSLESSTIYFSQNKECFENEDIFVQLDVTFNKPMDLSYLSSDEFSSFLLSQLCLIKVKDSLTRMHSHLFQLDVIK